MRRTLMLVYGTACYLLTGLATLYFGGFLLGFDVPILAERPGQLDPISLGIDLALVALFGAQHSGMARSAFKRWWTRIVPPPIERSTYVLASNVVLVGLVALWQPLGPPREPPWPAAWSWCLWAIAGLGGVILDAATFQIDHADLFGLRQVWDHYRQRMPGDGPFQVVGLYRYVRHPLMTGLLLVLWAVPVISLDRLVLAAGFTIYILLALRWEERDLVTRFGVEYQEYRRRVPQLVPWGGRFGMILIGEHAEGCILPVRAQPGARKAGIKGEQNGALKVAVTAPPEDGRANEALLDLLRDVLGLKRSQVELIAGHTSREKKVLIRGLSREELAVRIGSL